jgi:uncharacterized membrane protein YgdD (TMEM256/DUF423 family)
MERKIIATAAFFGMTAVILDAFGAHKLKDLLATEMLAAFKTGARYQMYHAFLLLFIGVYPAVSERVKKNIYWLTVIGVALFSGSLYLLSTREISGVDFSVIGWLTPVGGVLLIAAWLVLFVNFVRKKS